MPTWPVPGAPTIVTLAAFVLLQAHADSHADVLLADFEGATYAGWVATGEAFGKCVFPLRDRP